jgi:primosomal protein N' (replication factor Y)
MSDLTPKSGSGSGYVEVALPVPLRRTFTYQLTSSTRTSVQIGKRIVVPFGKRMLTGYVLDILDELPPDSDLKNEKIRQVSEVLDDEPILTDEIIRLARWTADYYLSFIGEVLRASLPAGMSARGQKQFTITSEGRSSLSGMLLPRHDREQVLSYLEESGTVSEKDLAKTFGPSASKIIKTLTAQNLINVSHAPVAGGIKPKRRKIVRLIEHNIDAAEGKPLNAAQQRVISALSIAGGEMPYADLLTEADVGGSPINTLEKRGLVKVDVEEVLRDPFTDAELPEITDFTLTEEQSQAFSAITDALAANEYQAFLLHGVTGSGKTEIYIRAMRETLDRGKSALMLVPEIALTPMFSRRLRAVFGSSVAILHSSLSPGERYDEWRRIHRGEARIVIGTRSAIFAPLRDLGLVIVDEEHDASYRQHESPFYHARDVAVIRANYASAVVVLGSATPALETYYNAQKGKYQYLRLSKRVGERKLAVAETIDMRTVFKKFGKDIPFSPELLEAIEETFLKGEQSIILLNRRGFSQFVLCRTCGETIKCINCDITLTYHRRDKKLVCHYCNYQIDPPVKCPVCTSEYLYFVGEGTEKLEDELRRRFPKLRIARVDRDTISKRRDMERILTDFSRGELDMLVGTQMIAKGHDFPNVTLVGVVSVDLGLGLPDFRAAERTFQLLTQVAGRAGRGELGGRVMIQTYYPEHYALQHAREQDYNGFYDVEIKFREKMGYPPFFALASMLIKHSDLGVAAENARIIRKALDEANSSKACRILGPAPASLSRLKGEHRIQILIKSPNRRVLRETIDLALAAAEQKGADKRTVFTEIDPLNLM